MLNYSYELGFIGYGQCENLSDYYKKFKTTLYICKTKRE